MRRLNPEKQEYKRHGTWEIHPHWVKLEHTDLSEGGINSVDIHNRAIFMKKIVRLRYNSEKHPAKLRNFYAEE